MEETQTDQEKFIAESSGQEGHALRTFVLDIMERGELVRAVVGGSGGDVVFQLHGGEGTILHGESLQQALDEHFPPGVGCGLPLAAAGLALGMVLCGSGHESVGTTVIFVSGAVAAGTAWFQSGYQLDQEVTATTEDVSVLFHCSRDDQGGWHFSVRNESISQAMPFSDANEVGDLFGLAREYSWRMAGLEAQLGEGWIETEEQRAALVQRMKEDALAENEKAAVKLVNWRNNIRDQIQAATQATSE